MEIRCCCKPETLLGHVSEAAGLASGLILRDTVDELGATGQAFSGEERALSELEKIPTFEAAKKTKRGSRKGTKKTWKSEPKKRWT